MKISIENSPVKLRRRKLADGSESLFLDCITNGKHVYEFLKLYLIPEKTTKDRQQNERTLRKAEKIQRLRAEDRLNNKAELLLSKDSRSILLTNWITTCRDKKLKLGKSYTCLNAIGLIFKEFSPNVRLRDINRQFCLDFIDWLKNTYISPSTKKPFKTSTAKEYCQKFDEVLNEAVQSGIIKKNPWELIDTSEKIRGNIHKREFLTIDELKCLMKTPCVNDLVKKAFLFSCLTGLRISDIRKLRWEDICMTDTQPYISIVMQKTSSPIYIPLSKQALKWLPKELNTHVFEGLVNQCTIRYNLEKWTSYAGINKHITFHCARHTFATMMLTLGTDIYTVSKLLGHSSIEMTQIYAEIVDKRKEEAIKLLDTIK